MKWSPRAAITWSVSGPLIPSSVSLRWKRAFSYRAFGTSSGAWTNRVGSSMRMRLVGVDHPGPERDRRDVPLAGGPQAEDEPPRPVGQARLVGVPDHRRVEQGRRLQRVLLVKYEPISSRRLSLTGWSVSRCLRTCSNRCRKNSRVRWCRSRNSRITASSWPLDLGLGEGRDAGDDLLDPVLVRRPRTAG